MKRESASGLIVLPGDMFFDLVVNMKTAKTLGLTIPQSILIQAEQVFQ